MLYNAERRDLQLALVGDAMITRRMRRFEEEPFHRLVTLLREADCTLANLEMLFHDYEGSHGFQEGTYTRSEPRNLDELKWMGVDIVSTANNHAADYLHHGLLTTLEHCKEYDLPAAGSGRSLDEARAPAYFDSRNGRVAVLAASSTFPEVASAGNGRPDFPGRPGINGLHFQTTNRVDRPTLDALRHASDRLGYSRLRGERRSFGFTGNVAAESQDELVFLDHRFALGDEFRRETHPDPRDLDGIARWIRSAKKQADWVVYALHSHEEGDDRTQPAQFMVEFARWCIDQGCDVFVGHGPHFLRGMEIYKGRPIFYSLGNFIFQNETVAWLPFDAYARFGLGHETTPGELLDARSGSGARGFVADPVFWQSVVPVCDFAGGRLREIRLHPIDLGFGRPIQQRGRPLLAGPQVAEQTLTWLRNLSKPFGTEVRIENGVGVVRP